MDANADRGTVLSIGEIRGLTAGFGDIRPIAKGYGVVRTWRVADSHCPKSGCRGRRSQRRRLFGLIAGAFRMRWAACSGVLPFNA